jgi:hypothetical protein
MARPKRGKLKETAKIDGAHIGSVAALSLPDEKALRRP